MIEIMVALLLASLAILGLTALLTTSAATTGDARHVTEATALAQDKIEELRTETPVAGSETVDPTGTVGTGMFTRTWTVTTGATYYDIQVTVQWFDSGRQHSVVLETRRAL
jgi:Tfp pilus assembly protein PilV